MVHHFHGSPVWGGSGSVCKIAVSGAGSFVSFVRPDQLTLSFEYAKKVAIDNGAFTYWKKNKSDQINWYPFYEWLEQYYDHSKLDFFVIPDVIEGGEYENDKCIYELPTSFRDKGVPVWHLHESTERLLKLCNEWPRVCFGSSGEYAAIRTERWHNRMNEAFKLIYVKNRLKTKIHGLRMLDGRVMGTYPLNSADSTNLAVNIPKTLTSFPEVTNLIVNADYNKNLSEKDLKRVLLEGRCAVLKHAIEQVTPPSIDEWVLKNRGRGRPNTGKAMTDAERAKKYRQIKKIEKSHLNPSSLTDIIKYGSISELRKALLLAHQEINELKDELYNIKASSRILLMDNK